MVTPGFLCGGRRWASAVMDPVANCDESRWGQRVIITGLALLTISAAATTISQPTPSALSGSPGVYPNSPKRI
jgi:hypothetical protein